MPPVANCAPGLPDFQHAGLLPTTTVCAGHVMLHYACSDEAVDLSGNVSTLHVVVVVYAAAAACHA